VPESSKARLVWMRAAVSPKVRAYDGVVSFISILMRYGLHMQGE
jgi:hypothetical protein